MIQKYPKFSSLNISIKDEVVHFTRNFEPYSDFSFINLFTWNIDDRAGVSWLNGNLVVKLPDYLSKEKYIYSVIGVNNLDTSIEILLKDFSRLDLVPQMVIQCLSHPEKYAIAEDRDSFDYIYEVMSLVDMNGKKYKKKRNIVNATRNALGERLEVSTVTRLTPKLRQEIREVFQKWAKRTRQSPEKIELEEIAINRLLDNFNHLDLYITLCTLDGQLNGFSVHEVINNTNSICHFEKSLNRPYPGAGAVLINEAAKNLANKSIIVNWEQDLGLAGLRKAKSSYYPSNFHRKYWISLGDPKPKDRPLL